jgi:hypothetical protein
MNFEGKMKDKCYCVKVCKNGIGFEILEDKNGKTIFADENIIFNLIMKKYGDYLPMFNSENGYSFEIIEILTKDTIIFSIREIDFLSYLNIR